METAMSQARAGHTVLLQGQRHAHSAVVPPGQSAHVVREELLVNPRYASLIQGLEDENLKLREALNAEKQQVLNLKVAFQTRAGAWKHELGKLEDELSEKQALEERLARRDAEIERVKGELKKAKRENVSESEAGSALKTLRELLDLFVRHIQEPIGAVSAACEELAVPTAGADRCPKVPGPVASGAADSEYVERLMRVVEVLRFFAKARKDKREVDQAELGSRLLGSMSSMSSVRSPKAHNSPMACQNGRADLSQNGQLLPPAERVVPTALDATIQDVTDPGLLGWMTGWRPGARTSRDANAS